jgi:succinyl-diaminopimelate desuccinylase
MDAITLAQELIRFKSITPADDGAIPYLADLLASNGFSVEVIEFSESGIPTIKNLFAKYGQGTSLCFAGHTDVVPPGDEAKWSVSPFAGDIIDGLLIGRGAVDMKGAIAAYVAAALKYVNEGGTTPLSFLITGDEEAVSINGTEKLLKHVHANGERFAAVIVGEPTNPEVLGEMIKIGRRGSATFSLTVEGIQGHVAYPDLADNPISTLIKILNELDDLILDNGNEYFDASNLEIINLDVGNTVTNLIPQKANALFNIRFNDIYSSSSLQAKLEEIISKYTNSYEFNLYKRPAESFITEPEDFAKLLSRVIESHTGITPQFSTTGGTSDARFIKDYAPVLEFGLINKTAHKIDESIEILHIAKLSEIYYDFIKEYDLHG